MRLLHSPLICFKIFRQREYLACIHVYFSLQVYGSRDGKYIYLAYCYYSLNHWFFLYDSFFLSSSS